MTSRPPGTAAAGGGGERGPLDDDLDRKGNHINDLNLDRPCPHLHFSSSVGVARIMDGVETPNDPDAIPASYSVEIRVWCEDCDEPFRFIGVEAGLMPSRPMCSADAGELRAPIRPASSDPDFGMGIPGFAVSMKRPGTRVRRSDPPHPYDERDHGMIWRLP